MLCPGAEQSPVQHRYAWVLANSAALHALDRRRPHLPDRVGHDLHVHAVAAVLVRVAGPGVAHAVALGEGPVEQDVLRFMLAQDLEQAGAWATRRSIAAMVWKRGRADRDPVAGGHLS